MPISTALSGKKQPDSNNNQQGAEKSFAAPLPAGALAQIPAKIPTDEKPMAIRTAAHARNHIPVISVCQRGADARCLSSSMGFIHSICP
jgi:hypothetical protein